MFNEALQKTTAALREEFSEVGYAPLDETGRDLIQFKFRGRHYVGELCGRNADLIMPTSAEMRAGLALRVYLDGCARQVEEVA